MVFLAQGLQTNEPEMLPGAVPIITSSYYRHAYGVHNLGIIIYSGEGIHEQYPENKNCN